MIRRPGLAGGAAMAGAVLLAMPVLDVVLGGGAANAVRAAVGGCGIALLALSAIFLAGREER